MYSRHVLYCPSFGSAMPHRGEVSVCTSRQDTTVTPFYVKNETFSGSSVGGFSLVNAGTTVSNVSSELQASNNTPALPSEEASFTIVNGKTYTFSTDYTNRTFVPGYTVSVLCEIKVSGTTVASQSMTALGTTYTFTYTATSSGTATIRYTFVMTGGPFPPPPPSVSFSIDNVKISFDSTTYSTSYTCSTSAASGYKYGFNGKEKDDEINVDGGDYDFDARIYDGRLGRWLACDPLQFIFIGLTPYNFVANCPILFKDINGKILRIYYEVLNEQTGKSEIKTWDFDGTNKAAAPDNLYVKNVLEAYAHIVDNKADDEGTLENLASRSDVTNIKMQTGKKSAFYDEINTIWFNPSCAVSKQRWDPKKKEWVDGKQSAAFQLLHEGAHRRQHLDHPAEYKKDRRRDCSDKYKDGDAEEERVDLTIVNKAIEKMKKLGYENDISESHSSGAGYFSISPTSTVEITRKQYKELTNEYKAKVKTKEKSENSEKK